MNNYQAIARKFRPQKFSDVIGQEATVLTLQNAIKSQRLSHAYLFCGSKGTGKTTLARLAAKAMNCPHLDPLGEPCNACTSCKEITLGQSIDVLEIDGASHRGIEDIRQINDTVAYAAASGRYRIYIIDEVHMLTKEAFNALLKTLEEPPQKVVFFFATTEPYKILPTILSRCQRFNLQRISLENIVEKLKKIATQLNVEAEEEALKILAKRAEGGLRDAESLFDQVLAFQGGAVTAQVVLNILGMLPKERFFDLDQAVEKGDLSFAFDVSKEIFSQGKDYLHFVDGLLEHYRNLLMYKLLGKESINTDLDAYLTSSKIYDVPQLLSLIDELDGAQTKMRTCPNPKIALEALLLRVLRIHSRLAIETIVEKLTYLQSIAEKTEGNFSSESIPSASLPSTKNLPVDTLETAKIAINPPQEIPIEKTEPPPLEISPTVVKSASVLKDNKEELVKAASAPKENKDEHNPTVAASTLKERSSLKDKPSLATALEEEKTSEKTSLIQQARYDTLLQFAAVELEGTLKRNQ